MVQLKSYRTGLIIILLVLAALRALYVAYGPFDLSPDEAHYWEWSRRLDLSYYSKGPMVAYIIALFTSIFGVNDLGVRIGAVIFSTLSSFMIYLLGKELFNSEKIGFYSALLINIVPLFAIGSILMTTDSLLIFFWAGAVWSLKKAMDGDAKWWYAAGAFIGFGFLGKYTAVLLYACVGLLILSTASQRHWLNRREPYVAALISLCLATPVILWNIQNGQVTIKHTLGQAHSEAAALSVKAFFEFLGSQMLLITPLIFIALAYGIYRCGKDGYKEKNTGLLLAFFTSAPVMVFFLFKSFHGKVQANWAVASYVSAVPAAVWAVGLLYEKIKAKKALAAVIFIGAFFGVFMSVLSYFPWPLEALGAKRIISGPPYNRVTGWSSLGAKVSDIKREMEAAGPVFIMSDTYQITSELAMYAEGNPEVYNVDTGTRRMNQYDLWPGIETHIGHNSLYIKGGNAEMETFLAEAFDGCEKETIKIVIKEGIEKEFSAFRCLNFKGIDRPGSQKRY